MPARASADVRWVLDRCEALREETGGFFDASAGGTLDPSALVKGWSVQHGAEVLCAGGVDDFCLSAGGDIVCRGDSTHLAIATSATYERGEHNLDPRTGRHRRAYCP